MVSLSERFESDFIVLLKFCCLFEKHDVSCDIDV